MSEILFPNEAAAWLSCSILLFALAVSAYIDLRSMVIPKWITVPLFFAGLVGNAIRGAWLGSLGVEVWSLPAGFGYGLVDGLLFGLAGAASCFAILLILWALRTCGGGDVKLFAAVGAWLGPWLGLYTFGVSLFVLVFFFTAAIIRKTATPHEVANEFKKSRSAAANARAPRLRVPYSLPIAVATLLVLVWAFRAELNLG